MRDIVIQFAIGLVAAAIGAFLLGLWRQRYPWRPGRMERWLYGRAERKLASMPDLSPQARAERIAQLREELNTLPRPVRPFGEQFHRDFLYAAAILIGVALLKLATQALHF